jgi:multiple antibiotic resistance protein
MNAYSFLLQAFVALLALTNPLVVVPVYYPLAAKLDPIQRRKISVLAAVAVAAILLASFVMGRSILKVFGINIADFELAGGVLLFLIALQMLGMGANSSGSADIDISDEKATVGFAIFPLSTPMLAGPGVISYAIILSHRATGFRDWLGVVVAILLVAAITCAVMLRTPVFGRRLGDTGSKVMSVAMGLIIGAIAMGLLVSGLKASFPVLR